jgi:SEC-C motif
MGAMAEAFVAFAQPLLDQTDGSLEQMNKALTLSQLCYSLALLPEVDRATTLREMQKQFQMDDKEFDEFRRETIDPMIRRHEAMFPAMRRRESPDLLQSGFSLPAHPSMAEPAKTPPITDRYAPCPCNSGKKYKFCCAKKVSGTK